MEKRRIRNHLIYILALVSGILLLAPTLSAQVNREELSNLGPVEFISYEGPHSRIETRAQIRAIGYNLGQAVSGGVTQTGALGRYFVIKSESGDDERRLGADIFGLGADVAVNHVRNLRLIIQGYLEAAYQYSESDAALLSEYITIYNAVYRGDWTYFSDRYTGMVMGNLSRERAGLAIRYDEWPGQTLMLIPLGTGLGGPLSAIDTSVLSDPLVIEQLRQEPDMGLEQRRDMVDLMEREADYAVQAAAEVREEIRQEEQRIIQEQAQIQREQQQIAQERQQPGADQQALDQRQEVVEQQQVALQQRMEELEEQRQEVQRQEEFAEERVAEAQEERQAIAEDRQTVIEQESLPPPPAPAAIAQAPGTVLGVSILNNDSALGRIVLIDNTGNVITQSDLNTVNARTVTLVNNRIIAIAGETRGSGAIRLVEINGSTLEVQRQGENDIAPGSLLWVNGQDIYAIVSSGGNINMGRFNPDLVLQSTSTVNVHPLASVYFYGGYFITQLSNGSAVLLDPQDLTER